MERISQMSESELDDQIKKYEGYVEQLKKKNAAMEAEKEELKRKIAEKKAKLNKNQ
jgi:septal ring factor EnvC (AmiA/AmiB activator)